MKSYFISATFTDHIGIGFLMIFGHCYRQRDGLRVAPAIAADTVLPDYEHVNLQAFGDQDTPRSVWDGYDKYQGPNHPNPNPEAKAKGSAFTQATEPPSPEEDNTLGLDHIAKRVDTSSEATHTPSPRSPKVPPRPKQRPKPKGPKQPDHPFHHCGQRIILWHPVQRLGKGLL